jgi:TctA family transporter
MSSRPSADRDTQPDPEEQFRSLMEGLRTTLPGVQVLFAFLLTLPLQPAFAELEARLQDVYYVALMASAVASVLLISPSVHQRVRATRDGIPRRSLSHVHFAVTLALIGTVVFGVALGAAVYLVSAVVFSDPVAVVAVVIVLSVAAYAWFWVPLVRFARHED